MNIKKDDKRELERFSLSLNTLLLIKGAMFEPAYEVLTENICSKGAFLSTSKPLPIDTKVKMDVRLPRKGAQYTKNKRSHLKIGGTVVRTEENGMAVEFESQYEIVSLPL